MGHAGHLKGWAKSNWGRSGRPLRAQSEGRAGLPRRPHISEGRACPAPQATARDLVTWAVRTRSPAPLLAAPAARHGVSYILLLGETSGHLLDTRSFREFSAFVTYSRGTEYIGSLAYLISSESCRLDACRDAYSQNSAVCIRSCKAIGVPSNLDVSATGQEKFFVLSCAIPLHPASINAPNTPRDDA